MINYNTHNILVYSNFSSNTLTLWIVLRSCMAWISVAALTILIEPFLQFSSVPTSKCHNAFFQILSNSLLANHLDISLHIFSDTNSVISKHINTPSPFTWYNKWTTKTCMQWDHLGTCDGSKPVSFTPQHICNHCSKHGEKPAGLCKASLPHVCTITAVLEWDACPVIWCLTKSRWLLNVRKFSVRKQVLICSSLAKYTCVIKNMLPKVLYKISCSIGA